MERASSARSRRRSRAWASRPARSCSRPGAAAQAAPRIAEVAEKSLRGTPISVVPTAGVITEPGQVEAAAAIAALFSSDGAAHPIAFDEADDAAETIAAAFDGAPGAAVLFGASPLAARAR